MSVTGKKGRDKSSVGRFGCQARSVCVTTVYILTQPAWALLNYMTARHGQAVTSLLPPSASNNFCPKGAGRICTVPGKGFSKCNHPSLGDGRSRAAAQSGWGSIHVRGCSRKVSVGEMLLPSGFFGPCALQGGRCAGGIQEPTSAEGSQQPLASVPAVF